MLPDGTIVVPIGSEDDDEDELPDLSVDEDKYGSVRTSLSDKYQKPVDAIDDDGLISHVSSSRQKALSEDLNSIVSLSDKYRQQEEVEIFHEHYHQRTPVVPQPIRPSPKKSSSSPSTASTSSKTWNSVS